MIRKTWWAAALGAAVLVGCDSTPQQQPLADGPDPGKPAASPGGGQGGPGGGGPGGPGGGAGNEAMKGSSPGAPPGGNPFPPGYPKPPSAGGQEKKDDAPKDEAKKDEAPKAADASDKLTDEEMAKINELPEGERAVAVAQLICPSSGEHLGSMGKPIALKLDGGKTVYICCAGCKDDVLKNPQGALAKIAKKK